MTVTETFMAMRVLQISRLSTVKRKSRFAIHCTVAKTVAQNPVQRNNTNVDTVNV